ncbi:transcription factor SPT20 homolog [Clytia hemisphaerica]|uniref:transcription factor SPT20 homolog n=1 Tax=Clytia hemisphaerica TaxID=252671 RepID=UPI0034D72677
MSAETVKSRKDKIPKYVLAHFHDDGEMNIVPKEKILNVNVLREFLEDRKKNLVVKALFFGRDKDGKKLEEIYEGRILEVNDNHTTLAHKLKTLRKVRGQSEPKTTEQQKHSKNETEEVAEVRTIEVNEAPAKNTKRKQDKVSVQKNAEEVAEVQQTIEVNKAPAKNKKRKQEKVSVQKNAEEVAEVQQTIEVNKAPAKNKKRKQEKVSVQKNAEEVAEVQQTIEVNKAPAKNKKRKQEKVSVQKNAATIVDIAAGEDDYVDVRKQLLEPLQSDKTPCESCKESFLLSQMILREVKESNQIEKVNFQRCLQILQRDVSEIKFKLEKLAPSLKYPPEEFANDISAKSSDSSQLQHVHPTHVNQQQLHPTHNNQQQQLQIHQLPNFQQQRKEIEPNQSNIGHNQNPHHQQQNQTRPIPNSQQQQKETESNSSRQVQEQSNPDHQQQEKSCSTLPQPSATRKSYSTLPQPSATRKSYSTKPTTTITVFVGRNPSSQQAVG